jgi:hypothetical protein
MTGLGTFDNTVSPAQVAFGLSASVNGQFLVLIGSDPKQ